MCESVASYELSRLDLGDGDMCTVTEEPSVGPKGARARAKLKMIGRQVTSCQNGSTCVQIGIKEYRCEMEEDSKTIITFIGFELSCLLIGSHITFHFALCV